MINYWFSINEIKKVNRGAITCVLTQFRFVLCSSFQRTRQLKWP